jgi:D-glycero-alpha-D-manno-heptose 1-phosphate guanylyltransferase
MEAIILAGGFGTRLRHIVSDVPKPMAPVNNKPFLEYIFNYLSKYNFSKIIMAVGYKSDLIKEHFGDSFKEIKIEYSEEVIPLGTGGAIKKAVSICRDKEIFIINGDTFFDVDIREIGELHKNCSCDITIAVKEMQDFDRYGTVIIENNRITKFIEKQNMDKGKINGGVYLINRNIFDNLDEDIFSFEQTVLESLNYTMCAYESDGYFIDIGIPEDYYKAQEDFKYER